MDPSINTVNPSLCLHPPFSILHPQSSILNPQSSVLHQKYAKDSQEKTDILLALDVPINPTVTNEKMGGRWGGPTETRFDKVGTYCMVFVTPVFRVPVGRAGARLGNAGVATHRSARDGSFSSSTLSKYRGCVHEYESIPRHFGHPRGLGLCILSFLPNRQISKGAPFEFAPPPLCPCPLLPPQLCKALETFVALYGHAQVPNNFEVPRETSWPEMTWDVKLGRSLDNIVSKVGEVALKAKAKLPFLSLAASEATPLVFCSHLVFPPSWSRGEGWEASRCPGNERCRLGCCRRFCMNRFAKENGRVFKREGFLGEVV